MNTSKFIRYLDTGQFLAALQLVRGSDLGTLKKDRATLHKAYVLFKHPDVQDTAEFHNFLAEEDLNGWDIKNLWKKFSVLKVERTKDFDAHGIGRVRKWVKETDFSKSQSQIFRNICFDVSPFLDMCYVKKDSGYFLFSPIDGEEKRRIFFMIIYFLMHNGKIEFSGYPVSSARHWEEKIFGPRPAGIIWGIPKPYINPVELTEMATVGIPIQDIAKKFETTDRHVHELLVREKRRRKPRLVALEVRKYIQKGFPINEIAETFKVPPECIFEHIKEKKMKKTVEVPVTLVVLEEQVDKILEQLEILLTSKASDKKKLLKKTVIKGLKYLPERKTKPSKEVQTKLTAADEEQAHLWLKQGVIWSEIGKRLKCHPSSIFRRVKNRYGR